MRYLRCVISLAALALVAQDHTFEVASIKPSNPAPGRSGSSSIDTGGGGLRASNVSAFELLEMALGAHDYQISGGPAWLRDDRYDIVAKNDTAEEGDLSPENIKGREARSLRMRSRIRALLADRFGLVLREQVKELPVYSLTVDKGGSRLKAVGAKGSINTRRSDGVGVIRAEGIPLESLCKALGGILDRPVIDETGLTGFFDIDVKYSLDNSAVPREGATEELTGPSIFTVVREALGLRLTGSKATVKSWVIVSADKPDEN
jgi:uncharacterized protein (TIGR03435 family)